MLTRKKTRPFDMKLLAAVLCLCTLPVLAVADDEVFVRSREKSIIGNIKSESPKGITIEKGKLKETFEPNDIVDINYDLPATPELKGSTLAGARKEEKDSLDPTKEAKRKAHLQGAIEKYKDTFAKAK